MPLRLSAFFVCLSTYLFSNFCLAQNLVLNPSFEDTISATANVKQDFKGVKNWRLPINYRTVFLTKSYCEEHPKRCYGFQSARTGEVAAGVKICSITSTTALSTTLQGQLSAPLQKGKIYQVEFYMKLADFSNIYMKRLDVALSPTPKLAHALPNTTAPKPWIINIRSNQLKNKEDWAHIGYPYMALGGEQFITIGYAGFVSGFRHLEYELLDKYFWKRNNIKDPSLESANYRLDAFYFIDDVSVTETPLTEENGRFSSIYFNSNSTNISESDLQRLEKLVKLRLSNIPDFKIRIEGFADKQGEEKDNTALSENRAKAVADYLIQHGVSPERVQIQGFGETQAAQQTSDNDRRVDVFLNLK